MTLLSYEYTTRVVFEPSIGQHNILLRCLPAKETFQHIQLEDFYLTNSFWHREGRDGFGNRIISGGTSERHSTLEYTSRGLIETTTYCIPDANVHPFYRAVPPLPSHLSGREILSRSGDFLTDVLRIMHFVHEYMEYVPGMTDVTTPLREVIETRQGVCQDYSHLMIALCRKAGYASRYVCGLMKGEGATHAWVEVHDGQCWYAFDPTNDTAIANGYIKLAHGRDAMDCSVSRGTYIGNTQQTTLVGVSVTETIM